MTRDRGHVPVSRLQVSKESSGRLTPAHDGELRVSFVDCSFYTVPKDNLDVDYDRLAPPGVVDFREPKSTLRFERQQDMIRHANTHSEAAVLVLGNPVTSYLTISRQGRNTKHVSCPSKS